MQVRSVEVANRAAPPLEIAAPGEAMGVEVAAVWKNVLRSIRRFCCGPFLVEAESAVKSAAIGRLAVCPACSIAWE